MIWALGLMSGTSADGVDAALIETDGETIGGFGRTTFVPYTARERALIRGAFGLWHGADGLAEVAEVVERRHLEAAALGGEVVGFHGQTLAHDPEGYRTHQLGSGAWLAAALSRSVVWDFRSADVLSGGEGAPLVPVFHRAALQFAGIREVTAVLNLGGVGNVTWVAPSGELLAFDTGPGNALLDDLMRARVGTEMDVGGALAADGRISEEIVADVLADPFFARTPPKSLDRDHFGWVLDRVASLATEHALKTLAAVTAAAVADAVRHMPEPPTRWLLAGGGRRNATVAALIGARTNAPVAAVEAVGLDGDMLEAQAFGYLAVRVLRGLPTSFPETTGARLPVCGGRISRAALS
ncbi:MAG: anhydro-N-acetylmuramic acid kinase [Pseudomonadota bacterium]